MRLSTIIYGLQAVALTAALPSTIEKRDTNTTVPQFVNYPGVGEWGKANFWYSQAVRIGDTIHCAGQGGWKPDGFIGNESSDLATEIAQAFSNVDLAIKTAGGQGWPQVYKVRSYHVPVDERALTAMVEGLKKWMPDSQPLWSAFGVSRLAQDQMHVEIEVEAWSPQN